MAKKIAWLVLGAILLELLLRTAGATYLLFRAHKNELSEGRTGDNSYIILCFGESTTAGGGAYSWPSQLETILNERSPGKRFTVINEGADGTNTAFILSELETNLNEYSPHIVITMMGANDGELYMVYENTLKSRIIAQLDDIRIYKLATLIWTAVTNPSETAGSQEDNRSKNIVVGLKRDEEMFKQAIQLNPDNDDAYVGLGRLYYLSHYQDPEMLKKAEEMFKKALEINPNNGDAYSGLAWVYYDLGTIVENTSLLEEAEKMFRKAIELDVRDTQLYLGLGSTYEALGMYQEAIETYEKHLELTELVEYNEKIYNNLGRLYHETGVPDEEIVDFYKNTGVSFDVPRNATAYEITKHHYRELYQMLGREGIEYIAMQYPTRNVDDLKQMFSEDDDVIFVSNEENFRQALDEGRYEDYFIDRCYGDFGHATPKGDRLIAENVASAVLTGLGMST